MNIELIMIGIRSGVGVGGDNCVYYSGIEMIFVFGN